jgi:hypothetical protein
MTGDEARRIAANITAGAVGSAAVLGGDVMIAAAGRYSAGMRWGRFSSALRTGFDGFKSSDRTSVTLSQQFGPIQTASAWRSPPQAIGAGQRAAPADRLHDDQEHV